MQPIYRWVDPLFLSYFAFLNLVYFLLFLLGSIHILFRIREVEREDFTSVLQSNSLPEISFIIPAYNEKVEILTSVKSLINLSYRYKQIIVVNDGSKDNTFELLREFLDLIPTSANYEHVLSTQPIRGVYRSQLYQEVMVIDKENGTKYDALNAGLNACRNTFLITVDADTFIDDESFETIIRPLLIYPDTIAVGASVRVKNDCQINFTHIYTSKFPEHFLAGVQAVEYFRAFLMRQGLNYVGGNFCLSGAFSCFLTDVVRKAGGFAPTFANDLEITLRLHRVMLASRIPYRIFYVPDPVAWTDTPRTFRELGEQRMVWHRGLLEAMWFHRILFFNPRYGAFGLFVFPFFFFCEAIEPIMEILGYIYITLGIIAGIVDPSFIFLFFSFTLGFTFILTLISLMLEEVSFRKYPSYKSILKMMFYSLLENFYYRQFTLIWRVIGYKSFYDRWPQIKKDSETINEIVNNTLKKGKL